MSLPTDRRDRVPGCCRLLLPMASVLTCGISCADAQIATQAAGTVIAGHVTNARTGASMARVLVQANGRAVFTSAEGHFELSDSAAITSVQFTKPGFALSPEQRGSTNVDVPLSVGALSLEVALWPEAVLAGTVRSPDGDPLQRIGVHAERYMFQNGIRQMQPAASTVTDSHGNFRLPVPAGEYVLQTHFAPPDFSRSLAVLPAQVPTRTANDGTGTLHVASGQELHIDLHPSLATAVHITLPIEGNTSQRTPVITVRTADGAVYQPSRRVTQDGLVLDMSPGNYQLSARILAPDGDRIGYATLSVPDHDAIGPTLHLDLQAVVPVIVTVDPAASGNTDGSAATLPNPSALNLQLEPAGSAPSDMVEQSIRVMGHGSGAAGFSVPSGTYQLSGGDGSGWIIEAATFGGVDLLRDTFSIGPNAGAEPIRIVVGRANGTVSGVTRIAGVPASCWVVLVGEAASLPHFVTRRSDATGQFNFSGLPLKRFRLLALPLLSSSDFGDPAVLDQFHTYVQAVSITSSSSAALTLDAVPVHELYP